MNRKVITSIFVSFLAQIGFSQDFDGKKLDSYFDALEKNNKFMGSVALSKKGSIIYTKQVGYLDVAAKIKPDSCTKYRVGSISKTFTAVLVFKAIEEKRLTLTDKLDKYFPAILNASKITIGNLLNHRSGIRSFTAAADYLAWNTQKKSEKELVDIIVKGGSDFEPDSKAEYSNSNFVLLSFILQNIYQMSYAQLLTEKIAEPIGLKNTYFGKATNPKDNESFSYSFSGTWTKEAETDASIPMGAGAVVSSPSDLVKFADALFKAKLVSNQSLELMKTIKDDYGLGLFRVPFGNKFGYGHNGAIDGFSSVMYHFADEDVVVAMVSNGSNYDNNQISIALLSSVYNKSYEVPSFSAYQVTNEDLDSYVGVYASPQMPLKITISKNNNALVAQATGQSAFALEATQKDTFRFDQAGIVLEFNPATKSMVLKQGGKTFNFVKE